MCRLVRQTGRITHSMSTFRGHAELRAKIVSTWGRDEFLCRLCLEIKPIGEFYLAPQTLRRLKLRIRCKACESDLKKQWSKDNPTARRRQTLKRYGLSLGEYEKMAEAQGFRCAICDCEATLCVDHDHDSGRIRGLLCRNCNLRLGLAANPAVLSVRELAYLRRHQ